MWETDCGYQTRGLTTFGSLLSDNTYGELNSVAVSPTGGYLALAGLNGPLILATNAF